MRYGAWTRSWSDVALALSGIPQSGACWTPRFTCSSACSTASLIPGPTPPGRTTTGQPGMTLGCGSRVCAMSTEMFQRRALNWFQFQATFSKRGGMSVSALCPTSKQEASQFGSSALQGKQHVFANAQNLNACLGLPVLQSLSLTGSTL